MMIEMTTELGGQTRGAGHSSQFPKGVSHQFWLLAVLSGWSWGEASSILSVSPGNRDTKSFEQKASKVAKNRLPSLLEPIYGKCVRKDHADLAPCLSYRFPHAIESKYFVTLVAFC
jgi:hypothetical protein